MLPSGTRLGAYEIATQIGSGGMGVVYRARDTRLGREVALKVLPPSLAADPDRLRRFEQEARAAGLLNHPHIVAVYDVGSHDGAPYLVSELLEGQTLRERMTAGPLPVRKAIEYAVQAAAGLAAAHEKGIVHRDLKPENVFVTREGRVKLLDFGLAKLVPGLSSGSGETETADLSPGTEPGVVMGTVGYMSPEQARGQATDHRSDIFSLGAVLYEMVSGRRAFQGASPVETMNAILNEEPPELSSLDPNVPAGLETIVRHCLEKAPEERFQSARDLAFGLASLSGVSAPAVAERPAPRHWRLLAISAALLAVGALAGVLSGPWLHRDTASPATYRRLTFRRGSISNARFTADGATVVYSAAWDGRPMEIYTSRVDSPEWRPLGIQGRLLSVSSAGELAILTPVGTLARVPLQGGAPREVLSGVADADWSPDGQQLAVVRIVEARYRLEYPIGTVLHESAAFMVSPRVSPDGSRVAFIEEGIMGYWRRSLRVVDRSGKPTTLATTEGPSKLCWSPNASEVYFSRLTDPHRSLSLYAVTLAGKERLVAQGPGWLMPEDIARDRHLLVSREDARYELRGKAPEETNEKDLSWLDWSISADLSADGSTVLFWESGAASRASVYLRGMDGSPATHLGGGIALGLSPDGKWALSLTEEPPQLFLLPTGVGDSRLLPRHGMNYTIYGTWFPDGKRVLFRGNEPGQGRRWYVQDLEGGKPRPVTPEGSPARAALSPDGRFVAAGTQLYPVDRGEPRPLPGLSRGEFPVGWSADGRSLYVYQSAVPAPVSRYELATGKKEPWKELAPPDTTGVSFIYRVHVTPDGRSYVYSYPRTLSELYLVEGLR